MLSCCSETPSRHGCSESAVSQADLNHYPRATLTRAHRPLAENCRLSPRAATADRHRVRRGHTGGRISIDRGKGRAPARPLFLALARGRLLSLPLSRRVLNSKNYVVSLRLACEKHLPKRVEPRLDFKDVDS